MDKDRLKGKRVVRSDGKVFTSLGRAAKSVKGCKKYIRECIKGNTPSAYGYTWSWRGDKVD